MVDEQMVNEQTVEFGPLTLVYDDEVLQPRGWTLAQSVWASDLLAALPPGPVLELFAGVGHIGLAAVLETDRQLVQVDLNPRACELARRNVTEAGLDERVDVRHGRIDEALDADERFRLVIADPPWVPSADVETYPDDPTIAIDGGGDGLDLARAACRVVAAHLDDPGAAILQLGTHAQASVVSDFLDAEPDLGLHVVEVRQLAGGVLVELRRTT